MLASKQIVWSRNEVSGGGSARYRSGAERSAPSYSGREAVSASAPHGRGQAPHRDGGGRARRRRATRPDPNVGPRGLRRAESDDVVAADPQTREGRVDPSARGRRGQASVACRGDGQGAPAARARSRGAKRRFVQTT